MKKTIATILTLPFYFISFAASNDMPALSSRSGFVISGIVTASVILVIALASGPNKEDNNHID
jgi:Kef-type K+ transport system membrane component KefB